MGTFKNLLCLTLATIVLQLALSGSSCSVQDNDNGGNGYIPLADRLIDWSRAGVWYNAGDPARPWLGTKGIPNYPVGITISHTPGHQYFCDPTGATDCSANLQAALNACPPHRAVYMPPGTYRLDSSVSIPSFKALRGAGAWQTTIDARAADGSFRMLGTGWNQTGYALATGYTRGSNQVVTSVSHPFAVGHIVVIDQQNIPGVISHAGTSSCTWCGRASGARAMSEALIVTAVSGNTITFNRPLYFNYEAAYYPELYRAASTSVINAGLEDLSIVENPSQSEGMGLRVTASMYCWMKGVRIAGTSRFAVRTNAGTYGLEIRRSYIHHASRWETSRGYGIHLYGGVSDSLIEDNIFKHNHVHISVEAGGAGNVIGYNYMETTQDINTRWYQTFIMFYGAHPYMNLVEGNVFGKFHASNYFGTTSHQIVYRNHITRLNPDHAVEYDLNCVIVDAQNHFYSFVGNVLGHPGMTGNYEVGSIPSTYNYPLVWKLGYYCCGNTGLPVDPQTADTMIRHGNYSYLDNTTRWKEGEPRTLRPSLYYNSKPSWFGSFAWPAIGPDVSGYVVDFPARKRWSDYKTNGNLRDLF